MANTLGVGPTDNTGSSNAPSVVLTGTTAGDGLIIGFRWADATSTLSALTCTGESAPTLIGSPQQDATTGCSQQFAYIASLTGGGSKTIGATLSASVGWGCWALTLHGQDTSTFYDTGSVNGANGTSGGPSVSITTNTNNDTIILAAIGGTANLTAQTSPAYTDMGITTFVSFDHAEYRLDTGSSGANTVTFSSTSQNWSAQGAAFKTAGAGGLAIAQELPAFIQGMASGQWGSQSV